MSRKLYVANLAFDVRDRDLQQLFQAHGSVASAQVATDRDTGRSRGFGFVEMDSDASARAAIAALDGKEVGGRVLTVHEAKPREAAHRARPQEGPGRGRRKIPGEAPRRPP
jgi:RNA recognition motif-containing protein